MIKIYHNNRCTKSRNALSILQENNIDFEVVEYLKQPLKKTQLKLLLKALSLEPNAILRKGETVYKELIAGKDLTKEALIDIIIENPILIERPIIEYNSKAIIARPPELVSKFLGIKKAN